MLDIFFSLFLKDEDQPKFSVPTLTKFPESNDFFTDSTESKPEFTTEVSFKTQMYKIYKTVMGYETPEFTTEVIGEIVTNATEVIGGGGGGGGGGAGAGGGGGGGAGGGGGGAGGGGGGGEGSGGGRGGGGGGGGEGNVAEKNKFSPNGTNRSEMVSGVTSRITKTVTNSFKKSSNAVRMVTNDSDADSSLRVSTGAYKLQLLFYFDTRPVGEA